MIIILSHRCNLSCLVARCDVLIGGLLQAMWIKDYESSFDGGYFGLCTRCGEALLAATVEQLGGNVIPTIHCFIVETYCPNIPRHPSYFKHEKNERCRKKRYFKSSKVFSSPHFDSLGTKRKKNEAERKLFTSLTVEEKVFQFCANCIKNLPLSYLASLCVHQSGYCKGEAE